MSRAMLEKKTALATGLIVVAIGLAACAPAQPATSAPAAAPTATQAAAPTSAPAAAPTATQAAAPTSAPPTAPPTAAPTQATASERVAFNWAPGSVTPADSDDVDEIIRDLMRNEGVLSGTGNETVLNIVFDPTVITVEEIMEELKQIGHPVVINEQ